MEIYTSPSFSSAEVIYAPAKYWLVYIASVIFTFFSLFTVFSSSTYLEQFMTSEQVSLIYAAGAFLAMVIFCLTPLLLQLIGNVRLVTVLMGLCVVTLFFIGLAPSTAVVAGSFILFYALSPIIYLNLDVFTETLIGGEEGATGSVRGLTLTLMSIAALAAPYSMGLIIGDGNNLGSIYFIAMGVGILFMAFIIGAFRHFYDPNYEAIRFKLLLKTAYQNTNVLIVLYAHFLLQLFFAWIIIYFPLYLATEVGLSWRSISEIIAFGLLAYIIFEYPIGLLADKYIGEKEMMAIGFVVLALSSAFIPVTATFGVFGWMLLMFISRVGASLVEVTTESYFFKQVKGSDISVISLFRIMRPLATFVGALLGTLTLVFLPLQFMFYVLGAIMATGTFATLILVDTK